MFIIIDEIRKQIERKLRLKIFLLIAVVNGLLAVALGAFGAHGLEGKITQDALARWETAVQYQMFHTAALLVISFLVTKIKGTSIIWSGSLMCLGIVLFSGSLYLYATTGVKSLAMITPFGGFSFLLGWTFLGYAVIKYL